MSNRHSHYDDYGRRGGDYDRPRSYLRNGDGDRGYSGGGGGRYGDDGGRSRKRSAETSGVFSGEWASRYDRTLPQDIVSRCSVTRCGVCSVTLSSTVVADSHYGGKR